MYYGIKSRKNSATPLSSTDYINVFLHPRTLKSCAVNILNTHGWYFVRWIEQITLSKYHRRGLQEEWLSGKYPALNSVGLFCNSVINALWSLTPTVPFPRLYEYLTEGHYTSSRWRQFEITPLIRYFEGALLARYIMAFARLHGVARWILSSFSTTLHILERCLSIYWPEMNFPLRFS